GAANPDRPAQGVVAQGQVEQGGAERTHQDEESAAPAENGRTDHAAPGVAVVVLLPPAQLAHRPALRVFLFGFIRPCHDRRLPVLVRPSASSGAADGPALTWPIPTLSRRHRRRGGAVAPGGRSTGRPENPGPGRR